MFKMKCILVRSWKAILFYSLFVILMSFFEIHQFSLLLAPINAVVMAMFASYLFAVWCSTPPNVLMQEYLVIRRKRNGELVLNVVIGNKNCVLRPKTIKSATCTMCFHLHGNTGINYENFLKNETPEIVNYYTFRFNMEEIPSQILKNIVQLMRSDNNCGENIKDKIEISLEGQFWLGGGWFPIPARSYELREVFLVDESQLKDSDYPNVFERLKGEHQERNKDKKSSRRYKKELWKIFNDKPLHCVIGERREEILKDIEKIYIRKEI